MKKLLSYISVLLIGFSVFATDPAMSIDPSTKNVGIGLQSPQAMLHTAGNVIFGGNLTVGNSNFLIDNNGAVGVGVSDPAGWGKVAVNGVLDLNNDSGTVGLRWRRGFNSYGYVGTGNWAVNGASTDDFGISAGGTGDLLLGTVAGTERVRIQNNGSVGIGISNPSGYGKLAVNGVVDINNDSGTVGMRWRKGVSSLGYVGTGNWAINGLSSDDFGISSGGSGDLVLGTGAGTWRLKINNNGTIETGDMIASGNGFWTTSDRSLKKDIQKIKSALSLIDQIDGKTYKKVSRVKKQGNYSGK